MNGWRASSLVGVIIIAAGASGVVAGATASAYTTHDYATCKQASSDGVVETRICAGYGGIPVRWIGEPDGDAVEFGRTRGTDGLGEDFSFVGKTVEWRGPVRGGKVAPAAAIVRVDVLRSISGPVRRRLLVVYKLDGSRSSCIAALVDAAAAGANERARKAADEIVPGFRCGTDQRRTIGS